MRDTGAPRASWAKRSVTSPSGFQRHMRALVTTSRASSTVPRIWRVHVCVCVCARACVGIEHIEPHCYQNSGGKAEEVCTIPFIMQQKCARTIVSNWRQ
eukprot:1161909-Pelagomonas_calceolata.AAC.7